MAILLYFDENCSNIFTKNLVCNMTLLLQHREENINTSGGGPLRENDRRTKGRKRSKRFLRMFFTD